MNARDLFGGLARQLGTAPLQADAQGAVGLRVGSIALDLRLDEPQDRIRISALAGRQGPGADAPLLAELLRANLSLALQGRPVIAIEPRSGQVALCCCLALGLTDGARLAQVVRALAETAAGLAAELVNQGVMQSLPA